MDLKQFSNSLRIKVMPWACLGLLALMVACVPETFKSAEGGKRSGQKVQAPNASGATPSTGASPSDGNVGGHTSDTLANGIPELRHIVDPYDGTYKAKVSLPKNFSGILYLSGINITSLSNKLVKARFKFGREMESITLPATIVRGSGITPQTDIQLVALDMRSQPFDNMRLLYDLYDYTDYRDTVGGETKEPTYNPRSSGLYCRGLKIEHDPTFQGAASNGLCDSAGETCNYAYAKVVDRGLVNTSGNSLTVTEPQLDLSRNGYTSDSATNALKKCLPDNNNRANFNAVLNTNVGAGSSPAYSTETVVLAGGTYKYFGPFRPVNQSEWQISGGALLSQVSSSTVASGLFQASYNSPLVDGGFNSFLFPRAGKTTLQANVEHFSSTLGLITASNPRRNKTSLSSSGNSEFMDGCNLRVMSFDNLTQENIGSCNVTATIELIMTDSTSGEELLLTKSTKVKLQLIRATNEDTEGNNILYTGMKTCTNNQACGAGSCCFNGRCWSNDLIAQCPADGTILGHKNVGEVCTSDYSCSSLCCNQSTGTCAVHVNNATQQILCSKSPGQQCVAREWCRREYVANCPVVYTGYDNAGQRTCARRCYFVPTYGDCVNGICRPPVTPTPTPFDEDNPDCSQAIEPPNYDSIIN